MSLKEIDKIQRAQLEGSAYADVACHWHKERPDDLRRLSKRISLETVIISEKDDMLIVQNPSIDQVPESVKDIYSDFVSDFVESFKRYQNMSTIIDKKFLIGLDRRRLL